MPMEVREYPRVTERVEDCPECHEVCGWCSWYRKAAREIGCGSQAPGRVRNKCEKAEALKGTDCGTCDGSGKIRVRREILT